MCECVCVVCNIKLFCQRLLRSASRRLVRLSSSGWQATRSSAITVGGSTIVPWHSLRSTDISLQCGVESSHCRRYHLNHLARGAFLFFALVRQSAHNAKRIGKQTPLKTTSLAVPPLLLPPPLLCSCSTAALAHHCLIAISGHDSSLSSTTRAGPNERRTLNCAKSTLSTDPIKIYRTK